MSKPSGVEKGDGGRKEPARGSREALWPFPPLDFRLAAQPEENECLWFKPPGVRRSAVAALGNQLDRLPRGTAHHPQPHTPPLPGATHDRPSHLTPGPHALLSKTQPTPPFRTWCRQPEGGIAGTGGGPLAHVKGKRPPFVAPGSPHQLSKEIDIYRAH